MAVRNDRLSALAAQQQLAEAARRSQRDMLGMGLGSLAGMAGGLLQSQQLQQQAFVDRSVPTIEYKPTIEAGDSVREVLQAETDEWLKDI